MFYIAMLKYRRVDPISNLVGGFNPSEKYAKVSCNDYSQYIYM